MGPGTRSSTAQAGRALLASRFPPTTHVSTLISALIPEDAGEWPPSPRVLGSGRTRIEVSTQLCPGSEVRTLTPPLWSPAHVPSVKLVLISPQIERRSSLPNCFHTAYAQ